jgi:membrane fusion protein (multidrug efflux system)
MREPIEIQRRVKCCVVLALGCVFALACSRNPRASSEEEASGNQGEVVAEVTLTRVERADLSSTLSVSGTIAALPNQDVRVSSLVPGRVAHMMVAEGDHVREGQALAKIEDRPFLDQIQQAEATVEQAKANLENARLNRERNENLFQRGIAARKDLEDARTQLSVSEAGLRQAQATLALARLQLTRTEVRSPLDGTVVKRLVSVGEQVDGTAAQPLFDVANVAEVELFGNVPALYLGKIRVGQALRIATDAFPAKEFAGHVVAISPAVDPSTNVGLVRIRIANAAALLRLGMFLTVQVPLETHPNALVVPPQAVYRDREGRPRVYHVQGDTAEAALVKLGIETSERVELLSGVKAGEIVILTGGYGLGEHAKIRAKP